MKTLLQKVFLLALFQLSGYGLAAQQIPDLIPFRSGKLWGYVNQKMVLKIPCKYASASLFQNDLAVVKNDSRIGMQYSYINKKGEVRLGPYYSAGKFYNGLAIVGVSENYKTHNGLIDVTGKAIIPIVYPYLYWTYNNTFLVAEDSKGNHFVYDRSGKILFETFESSVQEINNTMAILRKPGTGNLPEQFALVNLDGSFRIPFSSKAFYKIEENHLCYSIYSEKNKKDESGVMDRNGKIIIDPSAYITGEYKKYNGVTQYVSFLYTIKEGLCVVQKNLNGNQKAFGAVDTSGKVIIPIEYQELRDFTDGFSLAKKNNKYGIINKKNEVVVPFAYDTMQYIHEGKAIFVKNGKYGCISVNGSEVFPAIYNMAYDYSDGFAVVIKNKKMGFADKNGKLAIECKYDEAYDFENGYAMVGLADKYGYIDASGNEVIPLKYETEPDDEYDDYSSSKVDKNTYPFIRFDEDSQKGYPVKDGLLNLSCGYVDILGQEYFDDGITKKTKVLKSYPSICQAIQEEDNEAIKEMVADGVNLNIRYKYKLSNTAEKREYNEHPAQVLYSHGNKNMVEIVRMFVENGYDVNLPININNGTLLHNIVSDCYLKNARYEIAGLLIKYKADVNLADYNENTPLHGLAGNSDCDDNGETDVLLAKLLIENGANPLPENKFGSTPLQLAKKNKKSSAFIEVLKMAEKKWKK